KERRPLVLVPRETPLHSIHLRNMLTLADAGVTIAPPMPAFYNRPGSIGDVVDHLAVRILDQLSLHAEWRGRWAGVEHTGRERIRRRESAHIPAGPKRRAGNEAAAPALTGSSREGDREAGRPGPSRLHSLASRRDFACPDRGSLHSAGREV